VCALLATGCCERWAVRAAEEVLGLVWTVAVSVVVVSTAVVDVAATSGWRKLHRSAAAGKRSAAAGKGIAGTAGGCAEACQTESAELRVGWRQPGPAAC